jgi:hypothetical protein
MKPGISVCFVVKNGLFNGYPIWESLNSAAPFADEFVISEGYSSDDTYLVLEKFKSTCKKKVTIFKTNWDRFNSPCGEVISRVSQEAIDKCSYDWVYYLQADEIVHEGNYSFIRDMSSGKFPKFNSVSFPFKHCIGSWNPLPSNHPAYQEAIRMVRRIPTINLLGDAWNFTGDIHPIYPSGLVPKPIFHLAWVFPKNIDQKNLSQASIYSDMKDYQNKAAVSKSRIEAGYEDKSGFPLPNDPVQFPSGLSRLFGEFEYLLPSGVL